MKVFLVVAALAGACGAALGQHGLGECGLELTPGEAAIHLQRQAAGVYSAPEGPGTVYVVPLTMHVVRRSDGTGGLPPERVAQALVDANDAWRVANIQFCQAGPIRYIDSDIYYDITGNETTALRNIDVVPGTINIWFVNSASYCGISSFTTSSQQGIVMNNSCTALPTNRSTFPHEIGHYFDLYHTHETAFGTECVARTNCTTRGDLLCDTAADPTLSTSNINASCLWVGTNTPPCGGDPPYAPDPRNYMSYSRKECRDVFSPGQRTRAYATLVNIRLAQFNMALCAPPCRADWNSDGVVDFNDFLMYLNDYNGGQSRADLNGDGVVDFNDLLEFLNLYNAGC